MKNCLAVLSGRLFCQSEHIHVSGKGNRFYDSLKSHDIIVNVARQFIINVLPLATYATMAIRPCPSPHATSQSKLQSTVMWFCKSHDPVNDKNVPRVFECKDVPLNILVHRSAGWHASPFWVVHGCLLLAVYVYTMNYVENQIWMTCRHSHMYTWKSNKGPHFLGLQHSPWIPIPWICYWMIWFSSL